MKKLILYNPLKGLLIKLSRNPPVVEKAVIFIRARFNGESVFMSILKKIVSNNPSPVQFQTKTELLIRALIESKLEIKKIYHV